MRRIGERRARGGHAPRRAGRVAVVAVFMAAVSLAQSQVTIAGEPGDLAITGATVHVGDGATVISDATVVIRGGRIAAVGRGLRPPAGFAVLDALGKHVTPGLTASNTVLGLVEVSAVRATVDSTEVGRLNPHVRGWSAVNPDSELLAVAMSNGVLHAVVVPNGGLVSGTSAVMALEGWTREDMTLKGPAALHVRWPNMRIDRSPSAKPPVPEQEDKRDAAVEELSELFADARAHLRALELETAGRVTGADRRPRLEALAPVLSGEIPVVAHARTVPQMRSAMRWAERQGVRLVIAGGRDGWRMADELAEARVPVIVEPVRALPARDYEPYDRAFTNPVALHDAGVVICFSVGSNGFSAAHVRNLPDEAAMTLAFGMEPEAALRAITLSPAEVFGVADILGSVEVGKLADLVVWDGPPLELTSRVETLVLGGRATEPADRHGRLYRKYAARPALGR